MAEEPVDRDGPLRSPDPSRGGPDIDAAVQNAESNTMTEGVHRPASPGDDVGDSRLEQMREVDVSPGPGGSPDPDRTRPVSGPMPDEVGSGGAQRVVGARMSDRVAGRESAPERPPYGADRDEETDPDEGSGQVT